MLSQKISLGKIIGLILVLIFVLSLGYFKIREYYLPTAQIKIGGQILMVDLAQNPAAWQKGLSGRKSLAENQGMLFVFPLASRRAFWMKDMNFSIDIIWINEGKIVDIAPNLKPSMLDPLPVYSPRLPANLVLEVAAGFSQKNELKIGDSLELLTK
ncbi:MAG: hypothetical protein UT86_C0003G0007 [Candidatus Magasanikbacteria bacterium GW2011_GWC2_40_17]|uniref:DUF192 domain-containing protein n=1 Tax=Candidatus Magasanikbacteria bacterium GW2011_GWA2_42_32 TaxID=1619039 RepID=A0A0G1A7B3_9BACT|nr:MAG: hypothetical protein UT86_C0003G0007 [Candidatus Magasanikbacteria bacterium GW2011_GWC2_40_17]KKS56910.1 MAG: hypothetical protein UV20_C0004G0006 [Candidatus Magasanikbacteria bacterium GW2011_GWA2_42_32]OGH85520.1 MAG: hypothetical protein A2294_03245 [Candidatus Magasanikbacteria bacterium RIFOXYB2_FULL_38_10]